MKLVDFLYGKARGGVIVNYGNDEQRSQTKKTQRHVPLLSGRRIRSRVQAMPQVLDRHSDGIMAV